MGHAWAADGSGIFFDDDAVALVTAAYPHEASSRSHLWIDGIDSAVTVAEDAGALVARLGLATKLTRLTRPDGSPVWVRASAVTVVRPPRPEEADGGRANAVLIVSGHHQAVRETTAATEAALHPRAASPD